MPVKRARNAAFAAASLVLFALGPALAEPPSPGPTASPAAPAASPAPATSPAPPADPLLHAKARAEFDAWATGKIDLSHYIPDAAPIFTPEFVAQLSNQYLKPLGAVKTFTQVRVVTMQGARVIVYRAVCEKGSIDQAISWNDAGTIQYIRFVPSA